MRPFTFVRRFAPLVTVAFAVALPASGHAQSSATRGRLASRAVAHTATIPEGTEFYVVTTQGLSSKTAGQGDRVGLKVDENVQVDGVTLIAKGTPVRATVAEAKGAGMFGRAGKLNLQIESTTTVDGQRVPLRGNRMMAGKGRTGTMVALTALVSPVGVFLKGKNASYPEGTRVTVFTDETVTVAMPR